MFDWLCWDFISTIFQINQEVDLKYSDAVGRMSNLEGVGMTSYILLNFN